MVESDSEGTSRTFEQLFKDYWKDTYVYARSMTCDTRDAEDATLLAFNKLSVYINNPTQGTIVDYKAWLRTVVKRIILNEKRGYRLKSTASLEELSTRKSTDANMFMLELPAREEDQPEIILELQERDEEVKQKLQAHFKHYNIPEEVRQDIYLLIRGYTYTDIAQKRHLPIKSIQSRIRKALNTVYQAEKDYPEGMNS